jgi:hypothetical protein
MSCAKYFLRGFLFLLQLLVFFYGITVYTFTLILSIPALMGMSKIHAKLFQRKVFVESIEMINIYTHDWLESWES